MRCGKAEKRKSLNYTIVYLPRWSHALLPKRQMQKECIVVTLIRGTLDCLTVSFPAFAMATHHRSSPLISEMKASSPAGAATAAASPSSPQSPSSATPIVRPRMSDSTGITTLPPLSLSPSAAFPEANPSTATINTQASGSSSARPPAAATAAAANGNPTGNQRRNQGRATEKTTSPKNVILTEAGRAPWYDTMGVPREAYVIGVAGGSASGKTSVARSILASLPNVPWVCIVSQDSFYKPLTPDQSKLAFQNNWNFDHPGSFDVDLFKQCIADLKASKAVEVPIYSFVQHQRTDETTYLYGASVIIVEGLFTLNDPVVRDLFDLKIFVQADSDLMLARRIIRDTKERGRSVDGIIEHYLRWVKPAMDNYIAPDAKWADLIVPGQNNHVAVDVVAQHVKRQLEARTMRFRAELGEASMASSAQQGGTDTPGKAIGLHHLQNHHHLSHPPLSRTSSSSSISTSALTNSSSLSSTSSSFQHTNNLSPHPLPHSVHLLAPTPQLLGLLTIVHDASTSSEDFIFYTDRISSLVMEEALHFLPYRDKEVECNGTGIKWAGKVMDVENVCSISILRSGSVLEKASRRALPALTQGSLLIQSNEEDGEPQLYSLHLPRMIQRRSQANKSFVLLLDSQISTGAAAFMAIRIMLDHGVPEENIIFLSILASAKGGIWALAKAFPKVRIILACVDPGLKKLRIQYPPQRSDSIHHEMDQLTIEDQGQEGQTNGQSLERRTTENQGNNKVKTKTIYAITSGCGSIGDRYYRTT
ncbi:unnamed protein product [Sympodiomycopsis kandeliae]